MRKVVLYISMSLDGYIADVDGRVDFIAGDDETSHESDYDVFIKEIDTMIIGSKTYRQVVERLSPNFWPYEGIETYVITTNPEMIHDANVKPTTNLIQLVKELKNQKGRNIWINGGSSVVNQLLKEDLIDVFHMAVIPVLLGDGVSLFTRKTEMIKLKLVKSYQFNEIQSLVYTRKQRL